MEQRNTAPRRRGWKQRQRLGDDAQGVGRGTPPRGAGVGNTRSPADRSPSKVAEEHRPAAQGLETSMFRRSRSRSSMQRNTAPRRRGWKQSEPVVDCLQLRFRGTPPRGAGVGNAPQAAAKTKFAASRGTPPRGAGVGNSSFDDHLQHFCYFRGTPPRGAGVGNAETQPRHRALPFQRNTAPRRRGWKPARIERCPGC